MTKIYIILEDSFLILRSKENEVYFQHVPSHKGIKYNDMADSLAAKASMLIS